LIEELILKVWRMQDTDLNKFNKPGFIFSDLVYLGKHLILGFFRKKICFNISNIKGIFLYFRQQHNNFLKISTLLNYS
jgi:hypothetical protein|tara:strand:- start:317 stop:550 length:234 start_codon:yes stop_codon:yes gene_type:complete